MKPSETHPGPWADLDEAGTWLVSVHATDGTVTLTYPFEISMVVYDRPGQ